MKELSKNVEFGFWEKYDDNHTVVRFATVGQRMKVRSISWKNICNKFYYRRNAVLYVGNAELHFYFIGESYERKVKKVDG